MDTYYLIGIESMIDHVNCIKDLGYCYWKKSHKKMKVGDYVFLFVSDKTEGSPYNRVMFKLQVVDTDCSRDDKAYYKVPFTPDNSCFKLKNIAGKYMGKDLDHNDLEAHGISRYVQYKRLSIEQAEWLDSYFS